MEPRSGLSSPIKVLRHTDLPVPEGPSRTLISPAGRVSVTSDQTTERPKDFVSPVTTTSAPALPSLIHSPPRTTSERLRVGDLPPAVDPLRCNGKPTRGQQRLVLADLMSLLIEKNQHDRPVTLQGLHRDGRHARHHRGPLRGRQFPHLGELLMERLDEGTGDDLAGGSLVV